MGKQNAFFEYEITDVVYPNREAVLETEFAQKVCALQIKLSAGAFFRAQRDDVIVGEV